ncbi:MAG: hypothetical protein B7Z20_01180, partial [Sphingobium sp. 32-64-5]
MKSWPVQDAKARFSELLAACAAQGPQMVTKRGVETAVLVPAAEWHRIQQRSRPTLKQLLLSDRERGDHRFFRRCRPAPGRPARPQMATSCAGGAAAA